MRNATEKLQHRRHRPVYLAPTAVHLQHYSSKSYDSGEYSSNYDDHKFIEDLKIPLFVEIPQDNDLRLPITSPPCSNGSDVSTMISPVVPETQQQPVRSPSTERMQKQSSPLSRLFRDRLYKILFSVFAVVSDFMLLIFVCLMGLFFHLEVQVVKQRAHGRRGRVIVQQCSIAETRQDQYQPNHLLRPLQHSSASSSFLMTEDMV